MLNNQLNKWIKKQNILNNLSVKKLSHKKLKQWNYTNLEIAHKKKIFFKILPFEFKKQNKRWFQPLIIQKEEGILGIIKKRISNKEYYLFQAKAEPGNINNVQISPTVQATKSNYTQVHKGNPPNYLEYFLEERADVTILLDQLQSEQGARFFKKRNRNIIIEVTSEIEVKEDFCWLTLGQLKQLLTFDNVINMDTRTVISGIPYGDIEMLDRIKGKGLKQSDYEKDILHSELDTKNALNSMEGIISWITKHKAFAELEVQKIPLKSISDWNKDDESIHHEAYKYFSVIAVRAEIGNREVHSWTQPLVKSAQEGIIAFLVKKINGVFHFLIQEKLESGNFDIIELAPTVQCLTGNYRKGESEYEVEFLDYVLDPISKNATVRYSAFQSEEGGRFFEEQNKNMIIEVDEDFNVNVPDKYIWMTLNQMKAFIKFNNYLNIQSRSLLSAVKFV